jgi:sec-independent protein translocase protein TatA
MGGLSIWHWLVILGVVLLLFGGAGKISGLMGDVAKGVKAFKAGLKDDDEDAPKSEAPAAPAQAIPQAQTSSAQQQHEKKPAA